MKSKNSYLSLAVAFFLTLSSSIGFGSDAKQIDKVTSLGSNKTVSPEEKPYRPPVLATSAVIEVYKEKDVIGIIVIDRWNAPLGKALPGGKVEYGESVEHALVREMKEELNIDLFDVEPFRIYSDPARDPRFHCVDILFLAKTKDIPKAGDDAARAWVVTVEDALQMELVFDHKEMLRDYVRYKNISHKKEDPKKGPDPKKFGESPSCNVSKGFLHTNSLR